MRICQECKKAHNRDTILCGSCRYRSKPPRKCDQCGKLHRRETRSCRACKRPPYCKTCEVLLEPGSLSMCNRCRAAACWLQHYTPIRPPNGWPKGHLERLAKRAEQELPLFGDD